jgi:hypothetical protein
MEKQVHLVEQAISLIIRSFNVLSNRVRESEELKGSK